MFKKMLKEKKNSVSNIPLGDNLLWGEEWISRCQWLYGCIVAGVCIGCGEVGAKDKGEADVDTWTPCVESDANLFIFHPLFCVSGPPLPISLIFGRLAISYHCKSLPNPKQTTSLSLSIHSIPFHWNFPSLYFHKNRIIHDTHAAWRLPPPARCIFR